MRSRRQRTHDRLLRRQNVQVTGEEARVEIIGRPNCHLCEDAERVVAQVCAERGVDYRVRSIEDEPSLADRYAEYIPVILVDGVQLDFFRVDPIRLAHALDR